MLFYENDEFWGMKILLLNTFENRGGAAVACKRLMKALQKSGVSVKMLVRDKQTDNTDVVSVNTSFGETKINFFRFVWERLVIWLNNFFSRKNLFAVSLANTGVDVSEHLLVQEADVIHIHWMNQGFLSLKSVEKLIRLKKPVVWTMHDMWPCTGICHHARNCSHYTQDCGDCFFLKLSGKKDLSYRIFQKKLQVGYENICFVACSNWLKIKAEKSRLLKHSKLTVIPNPLDINLFSPVDKSEVRQKLGLSLNSYFLLFGAAKVRDVRKGFEYYFEALRLLNREMPELNGKLKLIFMGESGLEMPHDIPYPAHFTGFLTDEKEIADWYNAASLFVLPSLEENLPNMIMESMACGTPVVGFDTGGIPEMIDHKYNGYVARYKDSYDLMKGMCWLLEQADCKKVSENARKKVIDCYSEEIVAERFSQLYSDLLSYKNEIN